MLQFKANGKILDLSSDFSITINKKNPFFSDDASFSYPFKLPNTDKNRSILGFRHRIENTANQYLMLPAEIILDGLLLFMGDVNVSNSDEEWIEGSLMENDGSFYYRIKDMNLHEINMGEMVFESEEDAIDYINDGANKIYPERNMAFPDIFNDLYFGTPVNVSRQGYNKHWYDGSGIHLVDENGDRTIIIPFLYIKYVIKRLFAGLYYDIFDEVMTEDDYDHCVIYNSVGINKTMTDFDYDIKHWIYSLHVPRISIKDFLDGFGTFFNCRFFINERNKSIRIETFKSIITKIPEVLPGKTIAISTFIEDYQRGIKLVMELDGDDEKQQNYADLEEAFLKRLKGTVENIIDLPPFPISDYGDMRYVINDSWKLYVCSPAGWLADSTNIYDNLFSNYLYKYPDKEVKMKFSSLSALDNQNNAFVECGNKMSVWKEITARLFFIRYGWAGSVYKCIGYNQTNNLCFPFNGNYQTRNTFALYYKDYAEFIINRKRVKIDKYLTAPEIMDLDMSKVYQNNGVNYLIEEYQVILKINSIQPVQFKCSSL
jgi:hypothetical protein